MKQNYIKVLIALSIIVCLSACAGQQLSPNAQAKSAGIVMMDTYHAAYVDVKTVLDNPVSTQAQQDLARQERAILVQVKPLLDIYMDTVNNGGVPTTEITQQINILINQLIALGVK